MARWGRLNMQGAMSSLKKPRFHDGIVPVLTSMDFGFEFASLMYLLLYPLRGYYPRTDSGGRKEFHGDGDGFSYISSALGRRQGEPRCLRGQS
jgi:hypothetical protein